MTRYSELKDTSHYNSGLTASSSYSGQVATMLVYSNPKGIFAPLVWSVNGFIEASAADSSTMPCDALALEEGTGYKRVFLNGFIRNNAWSFVKGPVYVSTTTGEITQTAPAADDSNIQIIGYAYSENVLRFFPDSTMVARTSLLVDRINGLWLDVGEASDLLDGATVTKSGTEFEIDEVFAPGWYNYTSGWTAYEDYNGNVCAAGSGPYSSRDWGGSQSVAIVPVGDWAHDGFAPTKVALSFTSSPNSLIVYGDFNPPYTSGESDTVWMWERAKNTYASDSSYRSGKIVDMDTSGMNTGIEYLSIGEEGLTASFSLTGIYFYLESRRLPSPTFTPEAGSYSNGQTVTLSSPISEVSIRYTTDDTEPNESSTLYTGAIELLYDTVTTIRAKAYKTGWDASQEGANQYTIGSPGGGRP